jgi:hypothetical protein
MVGVGLDNASSTMLPTYLQPASSNVTAEFDIEGRFARGRFYHVALTGKAAKHISG